MSEKELRDKKVNERLSELIEEYDISGFDEVLIKKQLNMMYEHNEELRNLEINTYHLKDETFYYVTFDDNEKYMMVNQGNHTSLDIRGGLCGVLSFIICFNHLLWDMHNSGSNDKKLQQTMTNYFYEFKNTMYGCLNIKERSHAIRLMD